MARVRPVVWVPKSGTLDDAMRDLRFLAGSAHERVLALPADERTPYHTSSPDPLVVMERTATLHKLAAGTPYDVLVLPAESLCRRGLPFAQLQRTTEQLAVDSDVDRNALAKRLVAAGYSAVNTVEDPGTFALRGGIIDVYWQGFDRPFRVDLFGDTVESLKLFDPASQRTVANLREVTFGPAREVHLDDVTIACAVRKLRELADQIDYPTKKLNELRADLENRIAFFGIEALLPALYPELQTPLQVLTHARGASAFTVFVEDGADAINAVETLTREYQDQHRHALSRGDLVFAPEVFLASGDDVRMALTAHTQVIGSSLVVQGESPPIEVRTTGTADLRAEILRESTRTDDGSAHSLLTPLVTRVRALRQSGRSVLIPTASHGGVERLRELLKSHHLEVRQLKEPPALLDELALTDASVHVWTWIAKPCDPARGADLAHMNFAVIAEEEIFGKRARRSSEKIRKGGFKTTLTDLSEGDHVVHVEHGVGLFVGLVRLNVRGQEQDYLHLVYDGGDKLYLPVHRINLVQRYAGAGAKPPRLDRLGGTGWETTKRKVKAAVMAMAQDLLHLYAKRELAARPHHPGPDEAYWQFEAAFAFETTPDQQKAIDDVVVDMQKPRPMDRLICGDVGYGKTEVGMRAAMLAVTGGRQVAVLAPTTVLAQQHFLTFTERFKGTAANVEVISRFKKASEVNETLVRAKEGKVDILIGTHRLLSPDVGFKDLGLIVVDEEQRFGVKAKESLKKLKTNVDVLTLTATPIPRTLQMGFFGVRDMSVIETPPIDRRAIRTSIVKKDEELVREAVMRELGRGGQVYFVHNRVRSIQATADYVKRLVPEARVGVGHGQMGEDELEDVMLKFMRHDINVLVCTAIIETGIDVPSANTMFIDHADDFGVAQLYQLRGRVGRSKERAFAYLMIEGSTETLHPDARKRLEILQRFSDLGAGFQVAQHDLELRGAGDLLGKGQHGHVTAVGYDLYSELLRSAVEELKGRPADDAPDPDINLPIAALIPDKYIVDVHDRLSVYQRLAVAKDTAEIYDIIGGLSDQYGEAPAEVTALGEVMVLKMKVKELHARALDVPVEVDRQAAPGKPATAKIPRVVLTLGDKAHLDAAKLAAWVVKEPERVRITPQMKLIYTPTEREWRTLGEDFVALCRDALKRISDAARVTTK